jgi:tripartite motif-containing protein 13
MMASSRNVSVDELEALLECPICMERLNQPRSLPCFHNFCKVCLEKYVEGLRDGKNIETFPCPTCRSEFALKSNENVEGMAGNYFIRNMLEVMTLQQEAKVSTLYF